MKYLIIVVCAVQGKVGPYRQFVIYEKRRVYVQYVVFYKSDRPVPQLPPVPKKSENTSTSRRHSGATCHRTRDSEKRPSSEDERLSDSDDDDDAVDRSRLRSRRHSSQSLGRRSSSESVSSEHGDAMNDQLSTTTETCNTGACNSDVKKVSVTRKRTKDLLRAHGLCLLLIITTTATKTNNNIIYIHICIPQCFRLPGGQTW